MGSEMCIRDRSTFVLDDRASSSGGGGIPTMLIAILVLVVLGLGGLFAAVMVKQGKSKKNRKGRKGSRKPQRRVRSSEVPEDIDDVEQDWVGDEQVSGESDPPNWELQGVFGEDGLEWLEWPESSDIWWQRDESGYWVEWKQ